MWARKIPVALYLIFSMKSAIKLDLCIGCSICAAECHEEAIDMV